MKDVRIVGIAGQGRTGKDSLAELFLDAGYWGMSFGDFTREYSFERHKDKPDPISRENMTETSNWLRETRGADVILQEALKRFEVRQTDGKKDKGLLLWSIRAPIEAEWILEHGGELIFVETSDEVRYQRYLKALRPGEQPIDFKEFLRQEALQWKPQPGIPIEIQMDIEKVKAKATRILANNGDDFETFKADAKKMFNL
jgi:dephospho-CoA kinase